MDTLRLEWEDVFSAVDGLEKSLKQWSEFSPVLMPVGSILAVSRGGLIPGTLLSHRLKVPMSVIWVSRYRDEEFERIETFKGYKKFLHGRTLSSPIIGPLKPPVVVVDDIVDDGVTMSLVLKRVQKRVGKIRCVGAVLVKKIDCPGVDFWGSVVDKSKWVSFPWERSSEEAKVC